VLLSAFWGLGTKEERKEKKAILCFFGVAVPVIGVVALVWTITDIPGMLNPREYDKYIPAVYLIGLSRLSQNSVIENK